MSDIISKIFNTFLIVQESDEIFIIWAKELLGAMLILTSVWLVGQCLCWGLYKWGQRLTALTKTQLDDRILQRANVHVSRFVTILGLYLAMHSLPLSDKIVIVLSNLLYIALVIAFFVLIYQILDELLQWYIAKRHGELDALLSRQMLPVAEKLVILTLSGMALIVILKYFNYDVFSLVTAMGIGSLALGMAAKDTLAQMISGFTLMMDRPFRIGDRIRLSGGQSGDVQDIGLRSTKIRTMDNELLIIPNSDLCNSILVNQAFPDVRVKGRVNIGVAYGSDVEKVKNILKATASELEGVLSDPPPNAYFVAFGDSSLDMSLFFWVESYEKLFVVTDKLNTLILRRFDENGIDIPFPTRTVITEKGLD